jgi:YihY family inner membrane protein
MIARVRQAWERLNRLYDRVVGPDDPRRLLPAPVRAAGRWIKVFYGELEHQRAFDKAAALSYGSLVSLVPLLGLVFISLRLVGADERVVENMLFKTVLGDIPSMREALLPGLQRLDLNAIGLVGALGWLYIAVRIYMTMEDTYSHVFHVRVSRGFPMRVLNFVIAFSVGPVFIAYTLFGTSQISTFLGLSWTTTVIAYLLPPAMLTLALRVLPCTHVRWGPALLGGCLSGAMIELGAMVFSQYTRIFSLRDPIVVVYGAVGLIPAFLFWMYLLWLFVLLGAVVAYIAQNHRSLVRAEAELRREKLEDSKLPSVETAVELASAVALAWRQSQIPIAEKALAQRCKLPPHRVGPVLEVLEQRNLLRRVDNDTWTLTRAPQQIEVREVVDAWRAATSLRRKGGDPLGAAVAVAIRAELEGTLDVASQRWVEAADQPVPTNDPTDPGPATQFD